ncbi:hypothetical protein EJB05_22670, partial [Eragrostis curvula]
MTFASIPSDVWSRHPVPSRPVPKLRETSDYASSPEPNSYSNSTSLCNPNPHPHATAGIPSNTFLPSSSSPPSRLLPPPPLPSRKP